MDEAERLAVEFDALVAQIARQAPALIPAARRLGQQIVTHRREIIDLTRRVDVLEKRVANGY